MVRFSVWSSSPKDCSEVKPGLVSPQMPSWGSGACTCFNCWKLPGYSFDLRCNVPGETLWGVLWASPVTCLQRHRAARWGAALRTLSASPQPHSLAAEKVHTFSDKRPLLSGNLVCWNTPSRTTEIFWPILVLAWGRCLRSSLDWEVRQVDRSRNHAAFPQQWPQQNSLRYLGSRHRYTQDYLTRLQITEKAASSKNEIPG